MKAKKNILLNVLEINRKYYLFPAVLGIFCFLLAAFWNDAPAAADSAAELRVCQENEDFVSGYSAPLTSCFRQLHRSSRTLSSCRFADPQAEKPHSPFDGHLAFGPQRICWLVNIQLTYQRYSRYTLPVRAGPSHPIS